MPHYGGIYLRCEYIKGTSKTLMSFYYTKKETEHKCALFSLPEVLRFFLFFGLSFRKLGVFVKTAPGF